MGPQPQPGARCANHTASAQRLRSLSPSENNRSWGQRSGEAKPPGWVSKENLGAATTRPSLGPST